MNLALSYVHRMQNLAVIQRLKWLVLGTCVAAGVSWWIATTFLTRYESTAIISTGGSLSDFKVQREGAFDSSAFDRFAQSESGKKLGSERFADKGRVLINQDANPMQWVKPMLKISKADLKESVMSLDYKGGLDMMGIQIKVKEKTPEQARQFALFMATYFMDSVLRESLEKEYVRAALSNRNLVERIESDRIKAEVEIGFLNKRLKELDRIAKTYPLAAKAESRSLASIEKGGDRFMPIPNQMAAIETQIVDIREQLARGARTLSQNKVQLLLLNDFEKMARESKSGRELVDLMLNLSQAQLSLFTAEYDKEVLLGYIADFYAKKNTFDTSKFLAEPNIPLAPSNPSPTSLASLGTLLAAFVLALILFAGEIRSFVKNRLVDEQAK